MEGERKEGSRRERNRNNQEEIVLGDLVGTIASRWKLITIVTVAVTLLAIVVSFLITPKYRATAVILPINKTVPSFIEGTGLSSIVGLLGMGGGSSSSKIMAILKSNTIKERIISDHDLMKELLEDEWDGQSSKWKGESPSIWAGLRALDDLVDIEEHRKTGTITISTDYRDAEIAANISNWFIEELSKILKEKSFSMARHQRENIEEIIGSLEGHLKVPAGDLPDLSVFMQKMRDLEISEKAYQELLVQYYIAKFQEAKEDVLFQVIDEAKAPDRPVKPRKKLNAFIAMVTSILLCIFYVVATEKRNVHAGSDG